MALEMKTHKDIAAYEAKPMFGLTWRRLAAIVIMIFGGGAIFFAVTSAVLAASGTSLADAASASLQGDEHLTELLQRASTAGMYAMFPLLAPVALWAWLRPMGLKPEEYAQYFFRHQLSSKVTNYEDTYAHATADRRPDELDESLPPAAGPRSSAQQPAGKARSRRTDTRLRRSLSEHAEGTPQRARRGR